MIWICAPLVISDSHRHLEIHEPPSPCKWLYNCATLKYTLEVTGTESSVKALRASSRVKISLGVSPRLDRGIETPPAFSILLVYHIPEIDRAHYCTPNLSTPRSPLPLFLSVKLSLSLSLSFVRLAFNTLPRLFHTFTHPFSLTGFICTLIIFFWRLFKKTFSGPFLFLLENPETRFSHSVSRYRSANERRAFFIYTCCSALRSVSW